MTEPTMDETKQRLFGQLILGGQVQAILGALVPPIEGKLGRDLSPGEMRNLKDRVASHLEWTQDYKEFISLQEFFQDSLEESGA